MSFRHNCVEWATLYPEFEYFQDGDIDQMDLLLLYIVNVYNQMIKEDKRGTTSNYVLIPLMENASNFQISCLNSESHNKRIISVDNDVVIEGNTLLSDNDIEKFVILCINSEFMEFMQSKYGNLSRQQLYVTIVRYRGLM